MTAPVVDRAWVLAHRIAAHGLDQRAEAVDDLAVLDLGVQDTAVDSVRVALAARLDAVPADVLDDPALRLVWSVRGAPHLHRRADLHALAAALWPAGDADAMARLAAERAPLKAAGIGGVEAFATVAQAMRAVVTERRVKGEVSHDVSARLPDPYLRWCEPCGATHVYGGIFSQVGVFAGVAVVPDTTPAELVPLAEQPPLPPDAAGTDDLVRSYLRLHGPATLADAAAYLGTSKASLRHAWPDDLAEVGVDGASAWLPAERLDALRVAAVEPGVVRLLPPADPFLQARDRAVLVPDAARRKSVWRPIGNPGVVLAAGDLVGIWRAKRAGRRLDVTVTPFDGADLPARAALEEEAARVAAARGAGDLRFALA